MYQEAETDAARDHFLLWMIEIGTSSEDDKTNYWAHGKGRWTRGFKETINGEKRSTQHLYRGDFVYGRMHGNGIYTKSGTYGDKIETITGTWAAGIIHGKNIKIEDHLANTISNGEMQKGQKVGVWKVYNTKTQTTTEEYYELGVLTQKP